MNIFGVKWNRWIPFVGTYLTLKYDIPDKGFNDKSHLVRFNISALWQAVSEIASSWIILWAILVFGFGLSNLLGLFISYITTAIIIIGFCRYLDSFVLNNK
jgi:hypothetical protein